MLYHNQVSPMYIYTPIANTRIIIIKVRRITMDSKRAKEICESNHMVNVTHNGTLIYIDSVSVDKDTASIHPLNQPNDQQTVSISSLTETSD